MPVLSVNVADALSMVENDYPDVPGLDRLPFVPRPDLQPAGYRVPQYFDTVERTTGTWPTGDFTVSFWAYAMAQWYLNTASGGVGVYFDRLTANDITVKVDFSGGSLAAKVAANRGQWVHVGVARSGLDYYLSVQGAPYVSVLVGQAVAAFTSEQFYGTYLAATTRSRVAYYRMWNAYLGASELRAERESRTAVRTANLWTDTPLEQSLLDVSGNARHWSLTGASTPLTDVNPLAYLAATVTVQDSAAAVLIAGGQRRPLELLRSVDTLRVRGGARRVLNEILAARDGGMAAPRLTRSAPTRWYAQPETATIGFPSLPSVTPRANWDDSTSSGGGAATGYNLALLTPYLLDTAYTTAEAWSADETSPVSGYTALLGLFESWPLPAQVISGLMDVSLHVYASYGAPTGFRYRVYVWVSVGSTNVVRGVLLDYTDPNGYTWPNSARWWPLRASVTLTPVVVQTGDRVIVEVGYVAHNTDVTSYTGTMDVCASTSLADSVPNQGGSTAAGSSIFSNGYIDFLSGIVYSALVPNVRELVTVRDQLTLFRTGRSVWRAVNVTESQTLTLQAPVAALTKSVNEAVTVSHGTFGDGIEVTATSAPVAVAGTGLTLSVFEDVAVAEYRLRVIGSDRRLRLSLGESITVSEHRLATSTASIWNGSGSAPAAATIASDYWLVGA